MGANNPLNFNLGDNMQRLINLVRLDCQLERFAEVFGDIIEVSDCVDFMKLTLKLVPSAEFEVTGAESDPSELFGAICDTVETQIARKNPYGVFGGRKYHLLRAFFRFCNDAYLWEDCEDLERWETELFDNLTGYQQKNYTPAVLEASEFGREMLFLKYCDYIIADCGLPVTAMIINSVADWKGEEIKFKVVE